MYVVIAHGVISPADGVVLLKPLLDVHLAIYVVVRLDEQGFTNRRISHFAVFNDHLARFDDHTWHLEHGLLVLVRRVDRNVGIGLPDRGALCF